MRRTENIKTAEYTNYNDLPLFLNAELVAKVLGISPSSSYELMHEQRLWEMGDQPFFRSTIIIPPLVFGLDLLPLTVLGFGLLVLYEAVILDVLQNQFPIALSLPHPVSSGPLGPCGGCGGLIG